VPAEGTHRQSALPLTITIPPFGNIGNSMMQLAYAEQLKAKSARPVDIRIDLPEWGRGNPSVRSQAMSGVPMGYHRDRLGLVHAIVRLARPGSLWMEGLSSRVANLGTPQALRTLFPLDEAGITLPDDALVINVRAAEVVQRIHENYGVLPFSYFRHLADISGLRLVFFGQVDTEPYASALRRAFPGEQFISSISPYADFQTLRRARHLAIGVSTFSWLAAYIGQAAQVHMPVAGMFDPRVRPDIDLLPHDVRFRYHDVCPTAWANRFDDFVAAGATHRMMGADDLRRVRHLQRFCAEDLRVHARFLKKCVLARKTG